jgi:hypothetical protein
MVSQPVKGEKFFTLTVILLFAPTLSSFVPSRASRDAHSCLENLLKELAIYGIFPV